VKTGDVTLDELYGIQPLESNAIAATEVGKGKLDLSKYGHKYTCIYVYIMCINYVYINVYICTCVGGIQAKKSSAASSSNSAGIVSCPVCFEVVAGLRFAPHLEKCLNGGKRGIGYMYMYVYICITMHVFMCIYMDNCKYVYIFISIHRRYAS
jgi:hypothetical protein